MQATFEDILRVSSAIEFTENEFRLAMTNIQTRRGKGTDLSMGHFKIASRPEAILEAARQGFILMHSEQQLDSGFLFVKLSAGISFFGRQKAVYACYVECPLGSDEWLSGPVFK